MPNPNEYLAKESLLALKQDKLVAGDNITIDPITNRISAQTGTGTVTDVKVDNVSVVNASGIANVDLSGKQNTLTPGTNITIQNNVISATGGTEVEANPVDPATDTLTTVDIDGTVYEVGNGNTNYTELTQAQYDALTPEQKSNGELYFITDGQNSSVIPNPQDTPTDTLNTIKIDETVYDIAGSGGGTTVIANPSGTPTDTLSTIQIGNDIFEIEGGSGGGGGGYELDSLYHNSTTTREANISLISSFKTYDDIILLVDRYADNTVYKLQYRYSTDSINISDKLSVMGWASNTEYLTYVIQSETSLTLTANGNNLVLTDVIGIKYGSGSGSGEDGGYSSTLLWDYITDNAGTIPYGTYSVTLNDAIENYDILIGEIRSASGDSGVWDNTSQMFIDVNTLINSNNPNRYLYTSYDNRGSGWYISGTTMEKVAEGGGGNCNGLVRVYGLKFGEGGTNVEPNPQEEPTDTLSTIRIGDTVFDIEGGGSGGGYSETVIYENTGSTQASSMTLTDDIDKYDLILFEAYVSADNRIYTMSNIYRASTIISGWSTTLMRWSPSNQFINLGYVSSTELTCYASSNMYIKRIVGLKCGGSSGGGEPTSEVIPITAGDGTNSRTFMFAKTPKFIAYYWNDPVLDNGWNTTAHFVWGQEFIAYSSATNVVSINNNYQGCLMATYDGNSVTFTGGNAFSVCNTINGSGYMFVDYGEGGSGGSREGYSETSLWSGSNSATMQLSESFENYDAIMIVATASTQQGNYRLTNIWSVDYLKNHINDGVRFGLTGDTWYIYFSITDSTTFTRQDQNITYISEIKGLKFGESESSEPNISDMTWTQIISQTGGAWSSATAIPSGTKYLGIAIDHSSAVYMPKTLKLSELDKYASMLNYTIVRESIHWKHNTDNDDIYYEYDSANQTIKVYAGYSGLSVKVFAIS